MANGKIELKVSEEDPLVAYLSLPAHPPRDQSWGCAVRTIRLIELMPEHKGADIIMDFDADGQIIGIEILA